MTTIEAYPLTWPVGQPRVPAHARVGAQFLVGLTESRDALLREIRLLGGRDVVISSNLQTRRDGLPYADANEPSDPAIAVYFNRRVTGGALRPFVVACDQYCKARWNIRAVGLTIEAMRAIQRHGSSSLLEQAFTGFAALPPASNGKKPWWEVLGLTEHASPSKIREAYFELSRVHHPDIGGDAARMVEINAAYSAAIGGQSR